MEQDRRSPPPQVDAKREWRFLFFCMFVATERPVRKNTKKNKKNVKKRRQKTKTSKKKRNASFCKKRGKMKKRKSNQQIKKNFFKNQRIIKKSKIKKRSQPWKPHGTHVQLQLSRLLGGVEQCDRSNKAGRLYPTTGATHGTAQRTVHRRRTGHPDTKGNKGPRLMEIGPQRASLRAASTAPQIRSPSASGLPSPCPEMRKRVAQGDFQLHSHQQCSNASRSVNQFLPRRPRGAYFVFLSSGARKVGRRIRQRGFLVGWYHLNQESTDLRRLRSDVRTGRVLGAVLCPSCAPWSHCRDSHADQRCSNVWGQIPCSSHIQTGNRHFKRLLTLIQDLHKCEIPWILTHPLSRHVWRTGSISSLEQHHRRHSVIFDHCAFGTPWRLRTKLIACHCDYQDILPLAEHSCNKHHVCAFSRRPHIQLFGEELSGRQFTARCKVLPPRLCSKLCNGIISREIGKKIRHPLLTSEHLVCGMIWDFVAAFQGSAI